MRKTAFRCHPSQETRRPPVNAHPILVPLEYIEEFKIVLQNLIVKENGIGNRCCGEQRAREENRAGWQETTAWAVVLEGKVRESGRQIAAENGQDLAIAAGNICLIKQNN
jgi:hypothetical protein